MYASLGFDGFQPALLGVKCNNTGMPSMQHALKGIRSAIYLLGSLPGIRFAQ